MNAALDSGGTLDGVIRLIRERTGLVFPASRLSDLQAAIRRVMAKAGVREAAGCLAELERDSRLFDQLIGDVTVGETYFFREPRHFALIADEIIPELQELRERNHVFRVWSAGCASGEEAYSLAILFHEMGLGRRTRILGTDISRPALARARGAVYSKWSLRGEGAEMATKYLHAHGARLKLMDSIRERVEIESLNLATEDYPSATTKTDALDLILCRNVLIYFDAKTIRDVARRMHACLAPGGWLITGPSDPLLGDFAPLEQVMTSGGVAYRSRGHRAGERQVVRMNFYKVEEPPQAQPEVPVQPEPIAPRVVIVKEPEPLAGVVRDEEAEAARRVRELANAGSFLEAAEEAARYPTSRELAFLHALMRMNGGQYQEAEAVLKRLLYLDRSLAVAHFTLGTVLERLGEFQEASRSFTRARQAALRHGPDEVVPLSDGEVAGRLASAAGERARALAARRHAAG